MRRLICNTFSGWTITNIVGAVQISCTPLPNGTECITYSADTLSVEGGTAPFTWSVSAGTLPPGLTLAPSTGAITGTPTAAGTFNFTATVVDSTEPTLTATQAQTITIAPGCAPPPTTTTPPTPPTTPPTPPARARIDIDKRTRTRFARPGDLVTYRITVSQSRRRARSAGCGPATGRRAP